MTVRLFAALALAALAACSTGTHPADAPSAAPPARRIVSMVPSLTEDICAIGARDRLVGVSAYSNDIPCAKGLPQVSDFSSIDSEKTIALHADAVVAIPSERGMTAPLRRAGIATVFFKDDSYDDIFADITGLGALTGHAAQARSLIASLRRRTAHLVAGERYHTHPSAFVVLQAQPIWTAGTTSYISALVALAGARNAAADLRAPYAQYGAESLLRLQPDMLLVAQDARIGPLLVREPWRSLRAVQQGRVYVFDPSLLDRPGPRYNDALAWLIARVGPIAR